MVYIINMKNKIYWFTGQPGSGKTTLGLKLKKIFTFYYFHLFFK